MPFQNAVVLGPFFVMGSEAAGIWSSEIRNLICLGFGAGCDKINGNARYLQG